MGFYQLDLKELRSQESTKRFPKTPFSHQVDAFRKLTDWFDPKSKKGKGGLLVLPTGAGKTFTTVKWICDEVLSKHIRVLWLANSYYLLDQAYHELFSYARWMPESRETLNIRLVSGSGSHDTADSIDTSDDMLIISTQTAIKQLSLDATDRYGDPFTTRFREWIESANESGLFVVLDEAHHAPAYGCRNLLIGQDEKRPGIRYLLPKANLLGLTATPTYTDVSMRGWLGKIFETGIIYQADKSQLLAEGILSRPNWMPRPTGKEMIVSDAVYNKLVREHKDIPEEIIEKLANDAPRNDFIVNEYVSNKNRYGKTLIFADRWTQCVYLKEKLIQQGVRADAIYSKIDADPGSVAARQQRTATDNERILNEFKAGTDKSGREKIEVLINVRMLTEGADVPSVRTVFLTRQTTSQILFTQMIGRALRGKKAGGGEEANVVFFFDNWQRAMEWATPASLDGGTSDTKVVRGSYPLDYVSIRLVEELARNINSGGDIPHSEFSRIMPTGWYETQFVVASTQDGGEMQSFTEFAMVYEHTAPKFEKFMQRFLRRIPEEWEREFLDPDWMEQQATFWANDYFDVNEDDIGKTLIMDLIRIARHIAQRQSIPRFHSFDDRDAYDLDRIASTKLHNTPFEIAQFLEHEFTRPGSLWKTFYKSRERFQTAFDATMRRILNDRIYGNNRASNLIPKAPKARRSRELSEAEKTQVKGRDGLQCLCCGASGKGIRLQVDHILAHHLGGETTIDNSQTICSVCNRTKDLNELNFRVTNSPRRKEADLELLKQNGSENYEYTLRRLINCFYRCRAVSVIRHSKRRNAQFYSVWEIELYSGNDPKLLRKHSKKLLEYIREELGCDWVTNLKVIEAR